MAYIYQADVWCDSCGKAIIARLQAEGKAPKDPSDEQTYDSDQYPKYYDAENEESDGPENCASGTCGGQYSDPKHPERDQLQYGTFLENRLTSEGYAYLKSMLDDDGEHLTPPAKEWADYYQFEYHRNEYESAHDWLTTTLLGLSSDDKLRGVPAATTLYEYALAMAGQLDADQIQDLFESDMDDDSYFKESGWYSSEMEGN